MSTIAKLYGVNPNQIYEWRKRTRLTASQTQTANLLPVQVDDTLMAEKAEALQACSVLIEAQAARVTITGPIDAMVLRTILECLVQ